MLTVKSQRLLEQMGVAAALKKGASRLLVGPVYELRKDPGVFVRLAFDKQPEALHIGYAKSDAASWEIVESEPFSFRSLGYYERRLRRLGDWVKTPAVEILT